jgi:hypothetical protein
LSLEEAAELRAAFARVEAAERREAEAVADRRAAEMRAAQANERAARAERERAAAIAAEATAHEQTAAHIAEAVERERKAATAHRSDLNTGLVEENRALGSTVSRLLVEHEALTKRVAAALDALDEERQAHAKLRASRPDVQMGAAKNAAELEQVKVEAGVREKEIESNHTLATMLLGGLGTALLPMSEKLLTKMLAEKVPSTSRGSADTGAIPQPEGAKAPLQAWTELVVECWNALSHTSRMRAALALAESQWLNVLVVPGTHPIFTRLRDEVGEARVTKLVQMTYALTGISPVAPDGARAEQSTSGSK